MLDRFDYFECTLKEKIHFQVCGKSTRLVSFNIFFINEILCNSFLGVQGSSVTSYNKKFIVLIHPESRKKYIFLFLYIVFKERK